MDGQSSFVWRFPIAFQIIPLLFLFVIVWWFPESPRWLTKVGREEEARYVLGRLRGESGNDLGKAEAEFQDIRNIAELERKTAKSQSYFSMLFGIGSGKLHTGRRVQLVVWLQIMQEWIGIAGVTIYAPKIFEIAGISAKNSQWISGLNDIFYMVSLLFISIVAPLLCAYANIVFDSYLRLYLGSHWSAVHPLLGLCRSGHRHVPCRWFLPHRYQRQGYQRCCKGRSLRRRCSSDGLHLYLCVRCYMAYRTVALSG